jgi:hypothetical protein
MKQRTVHTFTLSIMKQMNTKQATHEQTERIPHCVQLHYSTPTHMFVFTTTSAPGRGYNAHSRRPSAGRYSPRG